MFFESFWLNFAISFGLIIALTFDYVTKFFSYWYVRHIPYKASVPFFGSDYHRVLGLRSNTKEVNVLYNQHPTEDFVGGCKSRIPDLIIRNPDLIRQVFAKEFDSFSNRGLDLDKSKDICLRNNLFYAEGEKWTLLREGLESLLKGEGVSQNCFLASLSGVNGNINAQQLLTTILDDVFNNLLQQNSNETVIPNLRSTLQKRSLLDIYFSYLKNVFPSVYVALGLSNFTTPAKETLESIHGSKFFDKIHSHLKLEDTTVCKKLKTNEKYLAHGIVSSMVSEGYIPCLNVLIAVLYELARNPQIQAKTRTSEEYLNATVKEALRMYPSFSVITRKCVKTFKFPQSKVLIDKKVTVNAPIEAIHRDKTYYKEAGDFKPERFLNGANNDYAFFPYGVGPRKCVGEALSQEIVKTITKALVSRFEIQVTEKTPYKLKMTDHNFGRIVNSDVWLNFKPL